ncbi:MAG: tyrosine-type recombinase/integrase, partial [Geothrix sp.]
MDKPTIPPDESKVIICPPEAAPKVRPNPQIVTPTETARRPIDMVPITGVISTEGVATTIPFMNAVEGFLSADVDSPNTRRAYRRHLTDAFAFFEVVDVRELNGQRLAAYRAHLLADGRRASTHSQALAALRAFLRWMNGTFDLRQFDDRVLRATLRAPRVTVMRPFNVLSDPEAIRILQAASNTRDRALVATLLGAGLRVSELCALDVGDLRGDAEGGDVLHVRSGKGGKDRLVPVHAEVIHAIHLYLTSTGRCTSDSGPLFLAQDRGQAARRNHRVGARAVRKLVTRLQEQAGVAKIISPHSFRHTYGMRGIRHGKDPVAMSRLLGHANLTTTMAYVDHLSLGELRRTVPHLPGSDHAQQLDPAPGDE